MQIGEEIQKKKKENQQQRLGKKGKNKLAMRAERHFMLMLRFHYAQFRLPRPFVVNFL